MAKIAKTVKKWLNQKNLVEKFFSRNRFRMFQNVLWTENLEIENFYRVKFVFLGLSRFSANRPKIVKKCQSPKILVENFFWSESIKCVSKCIFLSNLGTKERGHTLDCGFKRESRAHYWGGRTVFEVQNFCSNYGMILKNCFSYK